MDRSDLITRLRLNNDLNEKESLNAILCNFDPSKDYSEIADKLIQFKGTVDKVLCASFKELVWVGLSKHEACYLMLV